jgi:predicted aldo/keto reductase-like oxidoreductase
LRNASRWRRTRRSGGTATWEGLRKSGGLDLARLAAIAKDEGGAEHHFRFAQLPFNLAMVEAFVGGPESLLERAAQLEIAVVASASLMQGQVLEQIPDAVEALTPRLTPAQRAIQFVRSTPGIAVALAGMGRREHVLENLGVASVPPLPEDTYRQLYR